MSACSARTRYRRAGDLANWHTGKPTDIPAVGGAMDLAIGAKQTFVMMKLLARDGSAKLVPECTYPLTGVGCVSRIYSDLGVFLIEDRGVVVRDLFGIDFDRLQACRRAAHRRHQSANCNGNIPSELAPRAEVLLSKAALLL